MLYKAFLLGALFSWGVRGQAFGDLSNFFNQPDPFATVWERPQLVSRSAFAPERREREPLAPDYKDPVAAGSEQKPVLNPKETKEKHPVNPVIPGGVVDVDANSGFPQFPSFSSPFGPEFDFPGLEPPSGSGGRPAFGFGGIFGIDEGQKWWKGKNVCVEREESTDDEDGEESKEKETSTENKNDTSKREPNFFSTSIRLSNCFETDNKYECVTRINNHGVVKTFTVRYKCCYGFKRLPESNGCTKQVDLKPILQTLEELKLNEFRQMIKSSDLDSTFETANFTVFVPSDEAIQDYNDKTNEMNNVDASRRRRQLKNALTSKDLVMSHVTDGFIELADVENEQILVSEDNQKSPIRINIYPTQSYDKMLTANCARIKKGNILANNGIVHIVDRLVVPPSEDLLQIVKEHPKLSSFYKVLEKSDIPQHMKMDGHYTIFAPTDDAFNKLDQSQRAKLLNGEGCGSNILKHHIVAHTVCSAAIIGNATTHNVEGTELNMERTLDDDLIFEGKAKIIEADIIGTNGVIHLIDNVVIPESGQYLDSVLRSHNFTKFQELVQKAGLSDELNNFSNATVFVPHDKAFEHPQTKKILEEIGDDQEKLKDLVRYHAVKGQMESSDMSNNLKLTTVDNGKELRVNLYSTLPLFTNVINRATINCARLVGFDEKTCGSVVHEVSRLLVPPSKNILEMIESEEKYSTLRKLLKDTEVEKILQENNRSITFLAATDETFAALDENDLKTLLENKEKAEEVLKNHVLTEVLCCSGVGPYTWGFNSFVPTLGNQRVEVGRTGSQIRVNRAVVTSCDILATNGVVHTINKVLAPRKQPVATLGGGLFFFDI